MEHASYLLAVTEKHATDVWTSLTTHIIPTWLTILSSEVPSSPTPPNDMIMENDQQQQHQLGEEEGHEEIALICRMPFDKLSYALAHQTRVQDLLMSSNNNNQYPETQAIDIGLRTIGEMQRLGKSLSQTHSDLVSAVSFLSTSSSCADQREHVHWLVFNLVEKLILDYKSFCLVVSLVKNTHSVPLQQLQNAHQDASLLQLLSPGEFVTTSPEASPVSPDDHQPFDFGEETPLPSTPSPSFPFSSSSPSSCPFSRLVSAQDNTSSAEHQQHRRAPRRKRRKFSFSEQEELMSTTASSKALQFQGRINRKYESNHKAYDNFVIKFKLSH